VVRCVEQKTESDKTAIDGSSSTLYSGHRANKPNHAKNDSFKLCSIFSHFNLSKQMLARDSLSITYISLFLMTCKLSAYCGDQGLNLQQQSRIWDKWWLISRDNKRQAPKGDGPGPSPPKVPFPGFLGYSEKPDRFPSIDGNRFG